MNSLKLNVHSNPRFPPRNSYSCKNISHFKKRVKKDLSFSMQKALPPPSPPLITLTDIPEQNLFFLLFSFGYYFCTFIHPQPSAAPTTALPMQHLLRPNPVRSVKSAPNHQLRWKSRQILPALYCNQRDCALSIQHWFGWKKWISLLCSTRAKEKKNTSTGIHIWYSNGNSEL